MALDVGPLCHCFHLGRFIRTRTEKLRNAQTLRTRLAADRERGIIPPTLGNKVGNGLKRQFAVVAPDAGVGDGGRGWGGESAGLPFVMTFCLFSLHRVRLTRPTAQM